MRVMLSAMTCSAAGVSESYVAYNWVRQVAKRNTVELLTTDDNPPECPAVSVRHVSADSRFGSLFSDRFVAAVKPDYFVFDYRSGKQFATLAREVDVFHHIVPQAPRYPSRLGRVARRFVLGPVGGGLRVPEAFRSMIERAEPAFGRLRQLDRLRFRLDPLLRGTYDAADILLLTARYMLSVIPEKYHHKCDFLPETGIESGEYANETSSRPGGDIVRVLYVGRITPYKGLEFLLRAMSKLPSAMLSRTALAIVGAGEKSYEYRCRKLSADLGISDKTTFYGRLPRNEVKEHYRRADIFAFPTLAETTGNVLLEAMAMGLPVISTNYGGPSEVITEDSGILVDPLSPEQFVEGISHAIQVVISDNDLRRSLGDNARRRALKVFSWSTKGDMIQDIYERLAGNNSN